MKEAIDRYGASAGGTRNISGTSHCPVLLERQRVCVQPINYPTVPRGTERLRLTPTPLHDEEDLAHLAASLHDVRTRFSLRLAAWPISRGRARWGSRR